MIYHHQIEEWWAKPTRKLDWLRFEQVLVDILSSSAIADSEKVAACKEAIDAFTRRGHFFDEHR